MLNRKFLSRIILGENYPPRKKLLDLEKVKEPKEVCINVINGRVIRLIKGMKVPTNYVPVYKLTKREYIELLKKAEKKESIVNARRII